MADRGELRAGIFVLLALAVLGGGTLWIAGFSPFAGDQHDYEVWMPESGGVRAGDRVRVAGIEMGRVEGVELAPGEERPVRFAVTLEEQVRLTEGSTARITSDGLLGAPYLELVSGPHDAEPLPEGGRILGAAAASVNETLEELGQSTERLPVLLDRATELLSRVDREIGPLLDNLQGLLSDENIDRVSGVLARLEPTIDEIGERLTSLAGHLESLAGELEEGLGGVPELTAEVRGLVGDVRGAVGEDGEHLAAVLERARRTLETADGALAGVEGGGREVEALLHDLRATAANLRSLSQSLEQRPSLLLRSPAAPERTPGREEER